MIEVQDQSSDVNDKIAGTTLGGKDLKIIQTPSGSWKVVFTSGGDLPPNLRGFFTRWEEANHQVHLYLTQPPARSRNNAKNRSKG